MRDCRPGKRGHEAGRVRQNRVGHRRLRCRGIVRELARAADERATIHERQEGERAAHAEEGVRRLRAVRGIELREEIGRSRIGRWTAAPPGAVFSHWPRRGVIGMETPTIAATAGAQTPAALTTVSQAISPRSVTTPVTRPACVRIAVTSCLFGSSPRHRSRPARTPGRGVPGPHARR